MPVFTNHHKSNSSHIMCWCDWAIFIIMFSICMAASLWCSFAEESGKRGIDSERQRSFCLFPLFLYQAFYYCCELLAFCFCHISTCWHASILETQSLIHLSYKLQYIPLSLHCLWSWYFTTTTLQQLIKWHIYLPF